MIKPSKFGVELYVTYTYRSIGRILKNESHYKGTLFRCWKIKKSNPRYALDIIVAFPTETEADFETLVEKVNFEGAYTFSKSDAVWGDWNRKEGSQRLNK